MKVSTQRMFTAIALFAAITTPAWAGITASEVVYSDVTFGHSSYTNLNTVLGEIARDTGGTYVVTPWNCPWTPSQITIIASGTLTVKLSDYAYVTEGVTELGIYTAQMMNLSNGAYINGNMGASIYVSDNGEDWVALNNGEAVSLNTPSLGYQFPNNILPSSSRYTAGPLSDLDPTDQFKPFDASGIASWTDTSAVLAAYGDSAGGNWFDLSGTGLDRVLYVKLTDIYGTGGGYTNGLRIDGFAAVPEPATMLLLSLGMLGVLRRRGR
ncbi:MAG: PEP-CTERM sorting domain-containing protein [Phycisphaerales bacterium]|nr:PEP-CTERM sorting domain-containing protein [Phycisphaerales bacterium]